jgi:uncharacterized membrane protein YhaH (DUF805 family)
VGFTQSVRTCYAQKYATFSGRATRSEFWFFRLFIFLVLAGFAALFVVLSKTGQMELDASGIITIVAGLALLLFILATVIPAIAVSVRRVHDTNASGAFVLTWYIPYVGGLIGTVWACLPGTAGENDYGPDPKADVSAVFQ